MEWLLQVFFLHYRVQKLATWYSLGPGPVLVCGFVQIRIDRDMHFEVEDYNIILLPFITMYL